MEERRRAFQVISEQLQKAVSARKCHPCGCLRGILATLAKTEVGRRGELAALIEGARAVLKPKEYDCLGCSVCYPAVAANALAEAFPEIAADVATCRRHPGTPRRARAARQLGLWPRPRSARKPRTTSATASATASTETEASIR